MRALGQFSVRKGCVTQLVSVADKAEQQITLSDGYLLGASFLHHLTTYDHFLQIGESIFLSTFQIHFQTSIANKPDYM